MNSLNIESFLERDMRNVTKSDYSNTIQNNSFGKLLQNSINEVNELQRDANLAAKKLVSGEEKDIHNTIIAFQKAEVSFELIVQIQSKLMTAYDELKRMQI